MSNDLRNARMTDAALRTISNATVLRLISHLHLDAIANAHLSASLMLFQEALDHPASHQSPPQNFHDDSLKQSLSSPSSQQP